MALRLSKANNLILFYLFSFCLLFPQPLLIYLVNYYNYYITFYIACLIFQE